MISATESNNFYVSLSVHDKNGNDINVAIINASYTDSDFNFSVNVLNKELALEYKKDIKEQIDIVKDKLNLKLKELGLIEF